MLIGLGTGVEVGMSVAVAADAGGRVVAVDVEIVVLRAAGVDGTAVAIGTSGAGVAQDANRMANTRIGKTNLFKAASLFSRSCGQLGDI